MGTAYIDSNGNLVTSKDKKKKNTYTYIDENGNLASAEVPNIPVANKKKKNDWINLGAFDDGYDFGDVTKSILGTTGDVGTSFLKGVSDVGAGAGKLAVGGIAQVADWFGKDDYANKLRKSLAGENKKTNEWLENYTPSGILEKANEKADKYSISGEKLDRINESIGQIGAYAVTGGVTPALGTASMFGSAAGESLSQAYSKDGVTDKQAWAKAIGSGAIEVATERLFGLFGKSGLDTAIANKISGRLSNGISKILARQGIQATAEGTEEVISYAANQLLDMGIDKLSGKDAAKFYEKWNWEQVGEEFASAALASGIVGIGQTSLGVKDVKNNNNLSTKDAVNEYAKQVDVSEGVLTDNEQKVLNKELQNRIEEKTKDSKELSKKEINEIEDQVRKDMEKGRISVETIEEALGGNNTTQNDALLQNSYNERANRSVAYNADLSKYKGKQKEIVQKAIDSGVLNNTNRSHELVDLVAKLSEDKGMDFDFVNNEKLKDTGFALEGKQVNGYNTGTSIGINIDSNKALNSVIGHEITHVLEGTDLYNDLQKSITEYAKTKGEYDTRLKELQELYKDVKDANVENELTSDLVGDYLFTDEDFVNRLYNNNRNVFQKIYDEIKYFVKQVAPGSKEAKQLEQVKRAFEKAYNQKSQQTTGTKYSVTQDNQGRELSKQQQEYFKDSKVRDDNGNLEVVYHGSRSDFTIFDINKAGLSSKQAKVGFWFTESKEGAENFGNSVWYGDNKNAKAYEVYLNITNPKIYETVDFSEEKQNLNNKLEPLYEKERQIRDKYGWGTFTTSDGEYFYRYYNMMNSKYSNYTDEDILRDIEYSGITKNAKAYLQELKDYQTLENNIKELEKEKANYRYNDSYERFRTDIYKYANMSAEDANIGGTGMAINNENEVMQQYIDDLKQQGYDGIIIKGTNYDTETLGKENNQYVAFYSNQIKNIDNTNPTTNDDIRYSLSEQNKKIAPVGNYRIKGKDVKLEKIAPVKETKEKVNIPIKENIKTKTEVKENNKNVNIPLAKKDNVIKVNANKIAEQINKTGGFDVKQRSWATTSTESDVLKDKVYIEDLNPNEISYVVQSNKKSLDKANNKINALGYEGSINHAKELLNSEKLPTASDVAFIQRMIQESSKKGDYETTQNLIMDAAILGTDLGQATQALSIIKKLTPEGQLKLYTKMVQRAKVRGEKSFQNVEITPEMVKKVLDAYNADGTFDQNDLNARVESFKQDIADQMKTTVGEKIDAWRYLSMLGNPKTHIRNIVSNVAMKGTIKVKNAMARTLETLLPVKDRTKTWKKASNEIKNYAEQTANEMKGIITGENKYNEKSSIESKKQIFKSKTLEKLSNFNSNALEAEDWLFSKSAFKSTLQEYLIANNITTMEDIKNNSELVEKAKLYAVEQAEIATFRQYSKLASMINQFERKGKVGKIAAEALMPFKKTPINVAKAGVNYSPLGLIKNITYDAYQLKQGNINASQFIDNISQGMTGTSLTLLGYALAKAGILSGSGSDDKEGKYDKQLGKSGYSVNLGGKSYSISWLSPVAMPLLVGTNAYEQLEEQKDWDMNVVSDTLAKTLDPLNEMSFMQGLTNALQSYGGGADKIKGSLESALQNYVGQFFPTLFSQIASVTDDKKRSTRPSNNSKYKFGEQTARSIMYKIPGLRQQLEPVTDIWGNEKLQSTDILERAFETFLAPYSKTEDITTDLDKELKRVYNEVGETKVIPGIPSSYVKYQNETYRMSAKEYTQYKKTYGQTANETLNDLINSESYQNASEEDKTKMIENVYDYAKAEANKEYFDNNNVEYTNKTLTKLDKLNEEFGINPNEYFENKNEYDYAYKNPEKYKTIKQITSYNNYNTYKNKIKEIKDNTTNDKQETIKYINSLKLSVPQKAMFIKQYYKSFTDYDNEIINYINSKKISSKDKTAILEQLGFTVRNGRVYTK